MTAIEQRADGAWVLRGPDGERVLAAADTPRAAVYEVAADNELDPVLPDACEREAAGWLLAPGLDDPELVDLEHLPFVTIDEPSSLDLDQALAVEADGEDLVAWYAIADASHYVRPGSALFAEALARGATAYLPGLAVTMLPRSLCDHQISLNPHVPRRAVVFELHVGPDGRCHTTRVHRARVRSRAKLHYDGVQALLDGDIVDGHEVTAAVRRSLDLFVAFGERRLADARARHVVRAHRAEVVVGVQGSRFVARTDARNDVERFNEQLSLLANIEGARLLRDGDDERVQAIFRVHAPPTDAALDELEQVIRALVASQDVPASWIWDRSEPLAAYLRRVPPDAQGVARVIHRQATLTSGRSGFQEDPGRHHGVGAPVYGRFTAPMREVVGIYLHKELFEQLSGRHRPAAADEALRARVIEASHRARARQRELDGLVNRLAIDALLAEGTEHRGTVMGVSRKKVFVQLDEPRIDLKVYRVHLEEAWRTGLRVSADRVTLQAGGEPVLRVGDAVALRADGHDELRDRWRLALRLLER